MLSGWVFTYEGQILFVSDEEGLLESVANYRHSPVPKVAEFSAQQICFGQPHQSVRVDLFGAVLD